MDLFENQSWNELARPARWNKSLRPAMEELEARLPGMLGARIWLHRNVSWSDLEWIGASGKQPPAGRAWTLMYLVCYYRKALLGFQLVTRKDCCQEGLYWKTTESAAKGIRCFRYVIDTEDPAANLERIMNDICKNVREIRRRTNPLWRCTGGPVHLDREGKCLIELGLVKEDAGSWIPTERGEDCGLMTLFTAGPGGTTAQELRWSPSTWKALTNGVTTGPVSFQTRVDRLKQGLASSAAYAAEAVRRLAEMPLEEYFQSCPEVGLQDIQKLRKALGLQSGCLFRTAAAALYRRLTQAESKWIDISLMSLLELVALPVSNLSEAERNSVVKKFRKGRF